jgi:hypothetical protein
MYESPINIIQADMETQIENGVYKAVQRVGFDVNKEELLRALQYDRNQYAKGYNDAVEAFREYLKTVAPYEMPQDLWNMGVDNTCNRFKVW